jgi:hypothetical protein
MSDPTLTYPYVRIVFDPYNHDQVQDLLAKAYKEFGFNKDRWYYKSAVIDTLDINCWVLDFVFKDPHDATMFGLKYSK